MYQVWQGIPEINLQVFLPRRGSKATFCVFPIFKLWTTESPKMFKQILADLFMVTKGPLNKFAKLH